jgi:TonB family protein
MRVLVRGYPKSPPAREVLDRNAIEVEPESLAAWVALWEEAHPEADSAERADSVAAEGESSDLFAFADGPGGLLEGPPAPLRLSKRAEPTYPLISLGDRPRPGSAEVEVDVSSEGKIVNARIVRSSEEIFEGPALAAAYQCRYFPETNAGTRTANLMFEFRSGPR